MQYYNVCIFRNATGCQILRLKCIQFDFRCRPGWGNVQRSPDSLPVFKGPTCNEREEEGDGRIGDGRGERESEGMRGRDDREKCEAEGP